MVFEKITEDMKNAMKSGDAIKRDCLRSIISDIKNQTVNAGKDITDEACMNAIKKSAKQHIDSIENFKNGNRVDLVDKEQKELDIINEYLPKMLDEEKTLELIDLILDRVEPIKKNMGMIMKQLPTNVDRKLASKILSSKLK